MCNYLGRFTWRKSCVTLSRGKICKCSRGKMCIFNFKWKPTHNHKNCLAGHWLPMYIGVLVGEMLSILPSSRVQMWSIHHASRVKMCMCCQRHIATCLCVVPKQLLVDSPEGFIGDMFLVFVNLSVLLQTSCGKDMPNMSVIMRNSNGKFINHYAPEFSHPLFMSHYT